MGLTSRVQILGKAICISPHANALESKGMNLSLLPPAMG